MTWVVVQKRELRALSGPYWTLPVWVEWACETCEVARITLGAGIPLLKIQQAAAEEWLPVIGAFQDNGAWWAHAKCVAQFFAPREDFDEDPELIVEWRPWQRTVRYRHQQHESQQAATSAQDEFFHEFIKLGWLRDPMEARVIWQAFCQHAMHWLLNEGRPVDFLFFTLHALPFRKNWKEVAAGLWCQTAVNPRDVTRWHKDLLINERLTGRAPKSKRIGWTLEAVAQPLWDRFAREYERVRYAQKEWCVSVYTKRIRGVLRRKLKEASSVYADYISRVSKPYVKLDSQSLLRAVVWPPRPTGRGEPTDKRAAAFERIAYDYWLRRTVPPVAPEFDGDGGGEEGEVPPVPPVRLATGDVREAG